MGLCIALENEAGEALQSVVDPKNLLHKLLPPNEDQSNPMLASIDCYGNTVFNRVQMNRFIAEWNELAQRTHGDDEEALIAAVKQLALRCQEGVHLYIRFIGD
jgi:hypothetical protein